MEIGISPKHNPDYATWNRKVNLYSWVNDIFYCSFFGWLPAGIAGNILLFSRKEWVPTVTYAVLLPGNSWALSTLLGKELVGGGGEGNRGVPADSVGNMSITNIINHSLNATKKLLVSHLLKKQNLYPDNLKKNYRPVSNLPFLSKVLRKLYWKQLKEHILANNLIDKFQSAYRELHSSFKNF